MNKGLSLFTALVVILSVFASAPVAAQGTVLLYDDFNGDYLNNALWTFQPSPGNPSASVQVSGGTAVVNSGTTAMGGGGLISNQTFTPGPVTVVFETRLRVTAINSGSAWGLYRADPSGNTGSALFGIQNSDTLAFEAASNGDASGYGGPNAVFQAIPGIDIRQWHDYRIEVSQTAAEFYIDGALVATVTDPAKFPVGDPVRVHIDKGSIGSNESTIVEYVRVSQRQIAVGTDPLLNGCYVYAPNAVNEGDAFQTTVKCHAITSDVFGFQFGTTFTPSLVTRNGVPNQPVAEQVGTTYTPGSFALPNDIVGVNSLSALYAVSHTGTDTTTGDFTLGTFDANVPLGITANSSVTVDLRDLMLADRSGADIATTLPQNQAVITINNLFIAQREAGTLRVASDGTMTNLRTLHLNLDDGSPLDVATAPGSYYDFSVTAYQYPVDKQSADIAISMLSHLSCTKNVPLSDGLNPASVFGTTYTLKAGDANADGTINLYDAVLVGSYFGTSRTDSADINGDGTINIFDLVHIGRNYTAVAGTCS